jgi:putative transcriptional regulator
MENRFYAGSKGNYAGSVLIAHPSLRDPNFNRTMILLSAHSDENGAFGVVINRPLNKRLDEVRTEFLGDQIGAIPLYYGGPVSADEMILAAWQKSDYDTAVKMYFGLTPEKALALREEDPSLEIRGFIGYSGWTHGQLENELKGDTWIVCPLEQSFLKPELNVESWRLTVKSLHPELSFMVDEPEHPEWN